jgi:hypothetical protein
MQTEILNRQGTPDTIIIEHDCLKAYIHRIGDDWMGMPSYCCNWVITVNGEELYQHEHNATVSMTTALKFAREVASVVRLLHKHNSVIFADCVANDDRARSRASLYEFIGFQQAPKNSGFDIWYIG